MNKKIICMMLFSFIVLSIPTSYLSAKEKLIENKISDDSIELLNIGLIEVNGSLTINFTCYVDTFRIDVKTYSTEFFYAGGDDIIQNKNETDNTSIIFDLYLYELNNINENITSNYKSAKYEWCEINKDFNRTIISKKETNYTLQIKNVVSFDFIAAVQILATAGEQSIWESFNVFLSIITIIGIIFLSYISLYFMYKFRHLIHLEKMDNNEILKHLIKNDKLDPNKALEVLREMNKSCNKEGFKLSKSLSSIGNKIIDKIKGDQ
jgi:hypothetical protein